MKNYFRVFAAVCGATALAAGAEESAVVNRNKVNVRGGPNLTSEVITQLQKGETVTVLEDISVEKPKPGEPAKWSVIKLPANTPVWVYTGFLNGKTVKAPRLNLRGGPGENFSVLGRLEKGATVKEIRVVDEWMEIEAPDNTRAYVDAKFLGNPDADKAVAAAKPALTEEKLNVFEPAKPVTAPAKTEPVAVASAPKLEAPKIDEPKQPKAAEAKVAEVKPAEAKPVETKIVETKPATPAPEPVAKEVVAPLETSEVKEEQKLAAATPIEEPKKPAPSAPISAPAKPEENAAKPAAEIAAKPAQEAAKTTPLNQQPVSVPAEPATTPTRVLPAIAEPPPGTVAVANARRIVRREGDVRSTKYNIQAPTYFELIGERGKRINFLNGDQAGIQIKDYKGLHVVVTGEELIDPRFKESPMLNVETIEVAP